MTAFARIPDRLDAAIVMSGSGTLIPCHGGAVDVLIDKYRPVAWGGASGGGILALAFASGKSVADVKTLCEELLTGKGLLDRSLWPFDRFGINKGDRIRGLLGEAFGQTRMGDLKTPCRVVVCDLWTRKRHVVDNLTDPDVLLADAGRCTMAIPLFFKAARLRPNNARLFVDGGTVDNFPHGVFDDISAPTVGIRFAGQDNEEPIPVRSVEDYAKALFDLRQDAANGCNPSTKPLSSVLKIRTKSDGMRFDLDKNEVRARWEDGRRSAVEFLKRRGV